MASSISLTTIAALALAGVGSGLYLGKSAVAEIDPVYFSSASSKFYADLVPGGASFDAPAPKLQTAGYFEGLGDGCVLCETPKAEYYRVPDYSVDYAASYTSYVSAPAEEVIYDATEEVEDVTLEEARRMVERYAHSSAPAEESPVRLASATDVEELAEETPAEPAATAAADEASAPAS